MTVGVSDDTKQSFDYVTIFKQSDPIGKVFGIGESGEVTKQSNILYFGTGWRVHVPDVATFTKVLHEVSNDEHQVLMLGFFPEMRDGEIFELTTKRDYLERQGLSSDYHGDIEPSIMLEGGYRLAARLKQSVIQSSWMLIDRDETVGMPQWMVDLSRNDWLEQMNSLLPGLSQCGKVISASSSGRMVLNGERVANNNFHCYVQVNNPDDVERVGSCMLMNSFNFNLGYHKPIGKQGDTQVPWSIFDPTTFSRERLCYESKPVSSNPYITVAPADITYMEGERIDTSLVPTPDGLVNGLELGRSSDGSGYLVKGGVLDLNQLVETQSYGAVTVRAFRDDWMMPEKIRAQCFNRDSVSMNAYLQKLPGGKVLYFDNGSRLKLVTQVDATEALGGAGVSGITMQQTKVATIEPVPMEPVVGETAAKVSAGGQVGGAITGREGGVALAHAVFDVGQFNLIADVFLDLPEIIELCLINYQDTLYRYEDGGYVACETKWLNNRITKLLPACYHVDKKDGMPVIGNPGRNTVNSVCGCIMSDLHEENWEQSVPFWRFGTGEERGQADKFIVFRNGYLDIDTRIFQPSTPELFVLNPLPYDYTAGYGVATRWLKFLEEVWPVDDGSRSRVQEMMGYLLSNDTDMQALFMLIGKTGGGKGVIGRVIDDLVGKHSIAGTTMQSISRDFGLQGLIGKRVWKMSDTRISRHTDQAVVVERLLTITGQDHINVPRKFSSDWSGTLGVRPVIMSNYMPMLNEPSGALVRRIVPLKFAISFTGVADGDLSNKLRSEMSAIINWSLEGLVRLRANGRFTKTGADAQMKGRFGEVSNQLHGFTEVEVGEALVKTLNNNEKHTHDDLVNSGYALCVDVDSMWERFRQREGIEVCKSVRSFRHELYSVYPNLEQVRVLVSGQQKRYYKGMRVLGVHLECVQ